MATNQSVLIIGASGFIGRHTVLRLALNGWKVYAQHLPSETLLPIDDVIWFPCNLIDPNAVQSWPKKCDNIIYLAQSPAWRVFPNGARDVFEVNVASVLRTIEYARNAGTKHFIFASSGSVYSQTVKPAHEDELLDMGTTRSFYTASKLAAELLIQPYSSLMSVISLRIFMPYGSGQDAKMLIPQLVQRVREHQAIDLHGTDGMQINPIAVADLAETLERCLSLGKSAMLNVAGPETLTLREVGEHIGQVIGIHPIFNTHPEQIASVIIGDTTVLCEHLSWTPKIPFVTGLKTWLENEPGLGIK